MKTGRLIEGGRLIQGRYIQVRLYNILRSGQTDATSSNIVESNIVGRGGQTNATCWIQHLGSRDLENKRAPYWFAQKMTRDQSTVKRCLAALALLEMLEEEDDRVTKRGKTRYWIKRRGEKGYFNNIVRELMIFLPVVR